MKETGLFGVVSGVGESVNVELLCCVVGQHTCTHIAAVRSQHSLLSPESSSIESRVFNSLPSNDPWGVVCCQAETQQGQHLVGGPAQFFI